jgi:hypothetical protein
LDVVKAAATAMMTPPIATQVHTLMHLARRKAGERNEIAHGIWGVSNDYPDRLVLCAAQNAYLVPELNVRTRDDPSAVWKRRRDILAHVSIDWAVAVSASTRTIL